MNAKPMLSRLGWNIALVAAGLLLGFVFAAQWNITPETTQPASLSSREDLADTIRRLEDEQTALKGRIALLRSELTRLQDESTESSELLDELAADLEAQRIVAGLRSVRGPGIRLTLGDSAVENLPPNADLNNYILHDYDIRDVVNLLWASNAEAVAVNEERVVGTTAIYCVGNTIMVNDTRLSPPYEIKAIGDANKLDATLADAASLAELKARAKVYGLQYRAAQQAELTVPAFQGSFAIRYAGPAK